MKLIILACSLLLAGVGGAQLIWGNLSFSESVILSEPAPLLLLGLGLFVLGLSLRPKTKT